MSKTQEIIIDLLKSTRHPGIKSMIEYLLKEGFFESPVSTRFYGCYEGGLAKHSLGVYDLLKEFNEKLNLGAAIASGQKPLPIKPENIVIAALLHDVCKVGAYLGSEKPYRWNKKMPEGHATLSIARIKKHIELTEIEELMIKFHMGVYGLKEFYEKDSWEYKTNAEYPLAMAGDFDDVICEVLGVPEYPLRGDHSKDETMTKEESQKARYGESLRNAWFHNPVCKLMYIADELAVLEEKVEG